MASIDLLTDRAWDHHTYSEWWEGASQGPLIKFIVFPHSPCLGREQLERLCLIQKPTTCDPLSRQPAQSMLTGTGQPLAK